MKNQWYIDLAAIEIAMGLPVPEQEVRLIMDSLR